MTKSSSRLPSDTFLRRAIWVVLAALVVLIVAFGGYYIWDRYIYLGDQSPLDLSIRRMEDAVRDDPQNPDLRLALAEAYLRAGRYDDAIDQAEQIINLYPDHDGAQWIIGVAYIRQGQTEAALEPLERFVDLRKDRPMAKMDTALEAAYYFLGESYMKLGRPEDAIPVLLAALEITRTDADALYQLGLAYQATGRHEKALESFRKAVRLVPDFAEAYQAMVESYEALGRDKYVAYARGMAAFSNRDYEQATSYLEQATADLPDFAPAFLGLGLTYEKLNRLEEALAAVQQAYELDPNDFAAQQAVGRIQATLDAQQ